LCRSLRGLPVLTSYVCEQSVLLPIWTRPSITSPVCLPRTGRLTERCAISRRHAFYRFLLLCSFLCRSLLVLFVVGVAFVLWFVYQRVNQRPSTGWGRIGKACQISFLSLLLCLSLLSLSLSLCVCVCVCCVKLFNLAPPTGEVRHYTDGSLPALRDPGARP